MHRKLNLGSATLVLFAGLVLIAVAGFPSHASAGQAANSRNSPLKVVTVVIRRFKFEPATVTVHPGDTVEWMNDDIVPHTTTGEGDAQKPVWNSGTIQTGAKWRYVARKQGTFNYTCVLHPNMKGKLIVQ
jgi:plastocyanin